MSKIRLFWQMTAHLNVLLAVIALLPVTAFGQSSVGRNTNVVGPTPDGFFSQYLWAGDQFSGANR